MSKILVVDDDKELADALGLFLRNKGFEVKVAYSGEEAVLAAPDYSPAVVVQDYMLPDYDGVLLLKGLKASCPDTHVIIITARGSEEVAVDIMKAGASDYLKKPFEPAKLISTVENVLKLHSSEQELERLDRELLLQNRKLMALNAVSAALASRMGTEEKYRSAVRIVRNNLRADLVVLFTVDAPSRQLKLLASYGREEDDYPECIGEGLVSYVHQIKRPAVVTDFSEEKRFKVPAELTRRGIVSAAAVPMTVKDALRGVLAVYSSEARTFSSMDMKLIGNFANLIAMSVENDNLGAVLGRFQYQWQVAFDAVPDWITVQDPDHVIVMANRAAAEMAGVEVKDLIGQRCCWAFHTQKEPISGCPVSEAIESRKEVYKRLTLEMPEGTFDFSAYPVLDEKGGLLMVVEHVKKVQP